MKELAKHTYGTHTYMKLELDNGEQHEVDYYINNYSERYYTTADGDEAKRDEIIKAFRKLF